MDRHPTPILHRAERKYVVGKISDMREAKQRQFRAILNKLMPQNFDSLFQQIIEVYIGSPDTLVGLVSQIFDKALLEPTYCEIYVDLCSRLATALPDFIIDNKIITFRMLLLNKCQGEFERKECEEAEACKTEEDSEVRQTREERAEKRLKARRHALGNIQLIGQLYKKRMLTERIMHECIKKLLGPSQNPDEEDIVVLCKLMSTIGEMIDHPKVKEHMDAYFDIVEKLSMNQRYSSRIRYMLKDVIDLRKNNWRQLGGGSRSSPQLNVSSPRGEKNSQNGFKGVCQICAKPRHSARTCYFRYEPDPAWKPMPTRQALNAQLQQQPSSSSSD